jgi:hypothetical protein
MMTLNQIEKIEECTETLIQMCAQLRLDNARLLQNERFLKIECQQLREKNAIVLARLKSLVEQFKTLKGD